MSTTIKEQFAAQWAERYAHTLWGSAFGHKSWPKMVVMGRTTHVKKCENCGRENLKYAVACAVVGDDGHPTTEYHYFGSDCVSKIAGKAEKDVESEASSKGEFKPAISAIKPKKPAPGQKELALQFRALWDAVSIERYGQNLFDKDKHPRETKSHDGKEPGEFAPKASIPNKSLKKYKVKGTIDAEKPCQVCGKKDLARNVVLMPLDSDGNEHGEPLHCGSDCAAKLTGRKSGDIVREAEAADFATKKTKESHDRDKPKRIIAPDDPDAKNNANRAYNQTRRPLQGSYFASHDDGRLARVDGNDSDDIKWFEAQGFKKLGSLLPPTDLFGTPLPSPKPKPAEFGSNKGVQGTLFETTGKPNQMTLFAQPGDPDELVNPDARGKDLFEAALRAVIERYAVRHAPQGGVKIAGKFYPGGEFIPDGEWSKASAQDRAEFDHRSGNSEGLTQLGLFGDNYAPNYLVEQHKKDIDSQPVKPLASAGGGGQPKKEPDDLKTRFLSLWGESAGQADPKGQGIKEQIPQHERLIRSLAPQLGVHSSDVDDFVQDTMMRALQAAHTYDPSKASVGTWLGQVARSTASNRKRSAMAQKRGGGVEVGSMTDAEGRQIEVPDHRGTDKQSTIEQSSLMILIGQLPAAQRKAIEGQLQGKTHAEIATELGTSKQSVQQASAGAIKNLKKMVLDRWGDQAQRELFFAVADCVIDRYARQMMFDFDGPPSPGEGHGHFDGDKHPRWSKGDPQHHGGEFRPKDETGTPSAEQPGQPQPAGEAQDDQGAAVGQPDAGAPAENLTPSDPLTLADQPAPLDQDDPRQAASLIDQSMLDPQYAFARSSSVRNAGEDLLGSARHRANSWRGLEQAEHDGTAEQLVTRDQLLNNEPHNLMVSADKNPLTALAMYYCLKKFPPKPGYRGVGTAKDRREFVDAYRKIKAAAEEEADRTADGQSLEAVARMQALTSKMIKDLRAQKIPLDNGNEMADRYNSTANALCSMSNALGQYNRNTTSVRSQLNQFSKEVAGHYSVSESGLSVQSMGMDAATEFMGHVKKHAKDVIDGKSLNASLGKKPGETGPKKKRFNPSEAYVTHAVRVGGRDVGGHTTSPNIATAHLVNEWSMRGVQWGNYVTDDERSHHATKLVECWADLADVTGLHPRDLALDGKLGLAVGARGHGSALAHYEPSTKVINLTRTGGVGALAHEWGHAFDHSTKNFALSATGGVYGSHERGHTHEATDPQGRTWPLPPGATARPGFTVSERSLTDVQKGFIGVKESMAAYRNRVRGVLSQLVKTGQISRKKADEYWLNDHEMFARSFERWVQHKLSTQGRRNTYLAGLDEGHEASSLWPSTEEITAMSPAFEKLFAAHRQEKYGSEEPQRYSVLELWESLKVPELAFVDRFRAVWLESNGEITRYNWMPHATKSGSPAWRNNQSGDIRYQDEKPGSQMGKIGLPPKPPGMPAAPEAPQEPKPKNGEALGVHLLKPGTPLKLGEYHGGMVGGTGAKFVGRGRPGHLRVQVGDRTGQVPVGKLGIERRHASRLKGEHPLAKGMAQAPAVHEVHGHEFAAEGHGQLVRRKSDGAGFLLHGGQVHPLSEHEYRHGKLIASPLKVRERIHRDAVRHQLSNGGSLSKENQEHYAKHLENWRKESNLGLYKSAYRPEKVTGEAKVDRPATAANPPTVTPHSPPTTPAATEAQRQPPAWEQQAHKLLRPISDEHLKATWEKLKQNAPGMAQSALTAGKKAAVATGSAIVQGVQSLGQRFAEHWRARNLPPMPTAEHLESLPEGHKLGEWMKVKHEESGLVGWSNDQGGAKSNPEFVTHQGLLEKLQEARDLHIKGGKQPAAAQSPARSPQINPQPSAPASATTRPAAPSVVVPQTQAEPPAPPKPEPISSKDVTPPVTQPAPGPASSPSAPTGTKNPNKDDWRSLNRVFRAGVNQGSIQFHSALQRDLHDYFANEQYKRRGGQDKTFRRPERETDIDALAFRAGVRRDDLYKLAHDTYMDVRRQTTKMKDGEHRVLTPLGAQPSTQAQVEAISSGQLLETRSPVREQSTWQKPPTAAPPHVQGQQTAISVPQGQDVPAHYALMELEHVQPSHNYHSGTPQRNPNYPADLQPREYKQGNNNDWKVRDFARQKKAGYYLSHPDATGGAPVVSGEGHVINGNGRAMSLQLAAQQGDYDWYRQALAQHAPQVGIDPAEVQKMKHPVLVRVAPMSSTSGEAREFARAGNVSTTQQDNPTRTGASLGGLIDNQALNEIDIPEDSTLSEVLSRNPNHPLMRLVRSNLPTQVRDLYFTQDGRLTDGGKEMVTDMLLTKLLPVETVERMGSDARSLKNALEASIPQLMAMRHKVDITPQLNEALRYLMANPRDVTTQNVDETMAQQGLWDDSVPRLSPAGRMLVDFLLESRSQTGYAKRKVRDGLVTLAKKMAERGGLFGDPLAEHEDAAGALGVQAREGARFGHYAAYKWATVQRFAAAWRKASVQVDRYASRLTRDQSAA